MVLLLWVCVRGIPRPVTTGVRSLGSTGRRGRGAGQLHPCGWTQHDPGCGFCFLLLHFMHHITALRFGHQHPSAVARMVVDLLF